MNKENQVYVVIRISNGEQMPLELDEVRVFSTLDKAVDCLHHLYEDKLNEVEPYGEVDHYCADDMYEITLTEDCGTTFYQGYVRTKMVE